MEGIFDWMNGTAWFDGVGGEVGLAEWVRVQRGINPVHEFGLE